MFPQPRPAHAWPAMRHSLTASSSWSSASSGVNHNCRTLRLRRSFMPRSRRPRRRSGRSLRRAGQGASGPVRQRGVRRVDLGPWGLALPGVQAVELEPCRVVQPPAEQQTTTGAPGEAAGTTGTAPQTPVWPPQGGEVQHGWTRRSRRLPRQGTWRLTHCAAMIPAVSQFGQTRHSAT